jgi:hypothetical protein
MTELFERLSDRLIAADGLLMVDYDMGQLDVKPLPPLAFPCALISFPDATFEHVSDRVQEAPALVEVRLAYQVFDPTHTFEGQAPDRRGEGLAHLQLLQTVNRTLHQLAGDSFQDLVRVRQQTERRSDLRVYRITYRVRYREEVVVNDYQPWREAGGNNSEPGFTVRFNP